MYMYSGVGIDCAENTLLNHIKSSLIDTKLDLSLQASKAQI